MSTLELHLITPEETITFPGIRSVTLECPDGQRGVLPGHAPFIVELLTGVLTVIKNDNTTTYVAISGGVAEITPHVVTVVADSAEEATHIDVARSQEAAERAKRRILEKTPNIDFARAEAALMRSLARLRAAELQQRSGG
ncbi:MAG: ATP synthase F1 subunit epsilon [Candidatus Atribacteria bacterium]|nr:ATP synthase F1 subunit epsilon [Candidatus Atribacteria bacterium]